MKYIVTSLMSILLPFCEDWDVFIDSFYHIYYICVCVCVCVHCYFYTILMQSFHIVSFSSLVMIFSWCSTMTCVSSYRLRILQTTAEKLRLGYYRNLVQFYRVTIVTSVPWDMGTSTVSMGKSIFTLHWSLFQSRSYNCTWLIHARWNKRTNPRRWRASQWLCSPP